MKCPTCLGEISSDAAHCPQCGIVVSQANAAASPNDSPPEKAKPPAWLGVAGAWFLSLLSLLGILLLDLVATKHEYGDISSSEASGYFFGGILVRIGLPLIVFS